MLGRPDGSQIPVRIEAYGKGGSIRGASWGTKRPKIVILDDIQDSEDAKSDTALQNDWQWFLDDIKFLGNKTRFFMIANNLGEKCVIERVIRGQEEDNQSLKDLSQAGVQFKVMRIPVATDVIPSAITAWPEQYTIEQVIASREYYHSRGELSIWTRNMMCQCIADEDKLFRPDMFRYYPPSDAIRLAGTCNIYLRIDPAAQVKEASDYSAFVVCGINPDNWWFVLEVIYARMKQSEKIDTVFDLVVKWPLRMLVLKIQKRVLF